MTRCARFPALYLLALVLTVLALCANPAPAVAADDAAEGAQLRASEEAPAEGDGASQEGECRLVALIGSDNVMVIRNYEEADASTIAELLGEDGSGSAGADGSESPDGDGVPAGSGSTGDATATATGSGDISVPAFATSTGASANISANDGIAGSSDATDDISNGQPQVIAMYAIGDGSITAEHAPWYERRGAIQCVTFGERVQPRSMALWFEGLDQLKRIDFGGLDTSRVRDMQQLFSECRSLAALDATCFNTSCVTCMARMFSGCSGLASLDVSSFDTRNVTDMSGMFSGCSGLASLDLSQFSTENLTKTEGMFTGCSNLAALDVSGFTATQLSAAAIPTDNPGGFWKMNVPAGYDAGVKLREPSAAERAAAGITDGDSTNDGQGDVRRSGGEGEDGEAGASTSGAPSQSSTSAASAIGEAGAASATASTAADAQPSAVGATSATGAVSSADAVDASEDPSAFTIGALVINALSRFATGVVEPIAQLALDPAHDIADVSDAAAGILDALGIGAAVDKTMAMVAAAIGMLVAAGLVLTLCMKIR